MAYIGNENQQIKATRSTFTASGAETSVTVNYSQALRDLPSTASPKLDESSQLTNITWPTKPE